MRNINPRSAITLVEVVLVSVLLSALAVAALAYARLPGDRAKARACDLNVGRLQTMVQQYQLDYSQLPSNSLVELVHARYVGEPLPLCPVDGRPYMLNRQTGQVVTHGH